MPTVDVSDVFTGDWIAEQVLDGDITHFDSPERRGNPGDCFEVRGTVFEITSVEERPVADLDLPEEAREALVEETGDAEPTLFVHEFKPRT